MNVSCSGVDAIDLIDLEPIKLKLIQKLSGKGWTPEFAEAVEQEYRRFLILAKLHPDETIVPSVEVDKFWHQHILDTARYARDCQIVFGYFLHHNPYLGLGLEGDDSEEREEACTRTSELYEQSFGEPSMAARAATAAGAAFCAVTKNPAFCAVTTASAFCAVTKNPSFCAVTTAKSAFCAVTAANSAFCAVTTAKPAFCAVTNSDKAGRGASTGALDGKRNAAKWCETELLN
jgi:hypothetical protein